MKGLPVPPSIYTGFPRNQPLSKVLLSAGKPIRPKIPGVAANVGNSSFIQSTARVPSRNAPVPSISLVCGIVKRGDWTASSDGLISHITAETLGFVGYSYTLLVLRTCPQPPLLSRAPRFYAFSRTRCSTSLCFFFFFLFSPLARALHLSGDPRNLEWPDR